MQFTQPFGSSGAFGRCARLPQIPKRLHVDGIVRNGSKVAYFGVVYPDRVRYEQCGDADCSPIVARHQGISTCAAFGDPEVVSLHLDVHLRLMLCPESDLECEAISRHSRPRVFIREKLQKRVHVMCIRRTCEGLCQLNIRGEAAAGLVRGPVRRDSSYS